MIDDARATAIRMFNQALSVNQTDAQLSYAMFGSAALADPSFALAWYHVGCANADLNLKPAAIAAYRRVLEQEPLATGRTGDADRNLVARTLVNMGHRLYHSGLLDEAEKATRRALELDETLAFAWCNLSMILSVKGSNGSCVDAARRAYSLAPHEPIIQVGLAFALLFAGEYAEGLKHFEGRFAYKLQQFTRYPYPQWHGEDIEGKTLLLQADQGLGDTLSFVRFVPRVADLLGASGRLIFMMQPELCRLMRDMLWAMPQVEVWPMPQPLPVADFWSAPMSLPTALGLTTQEIRECRGLRTSVIPSPDVWRVPGRKLHVGICWAGSTGNDIEHWRRVPFEMLLDLYKVPGIQLYSLQVGERAQDVHDRGAASLVRDMMPFIRDVSDTLSIVNELDLVITVETSLGHMCGLIDKETWVLYSRDGGDFRLGRSERGALWYPNHRVFKQGQDGTWQPVIDRVVRELGKRVRHA